MAETSTARFGQKQWSAGTDSPSRADFNESLLNIENRGALGYSGTLAARPVASAANARGFYLADDTSELFWSTGSAWVSVGSVTRDSTVVSSAANKTPLTVRGFASQSAPLFEVESSTGASQLLVEADGDVLTGSVYQSRMMGASNPNLPIDSALGVGPSNAGQVAIKVRGTTTHTGDLLQFLAGSGGAVIAKVGPDGVATYPKVNVSSAPVAGTELTNKTYVDAEIDAQAALLAPLAHQHAAADISSGVLALARIPSLPASQITSGVIDVARIPQVVPAGVVVPFAGSSVPIGYLFCEGAAVSRTTFAALFAAIGTTYGAGNGSTTFNLPNLTDRVPMGSGTYSPGAQVGAFNHTLTESEMPYHRHTVRVSGQEVANAGLSNGSSVFAGRILISGGNGVDPVDPVGQNFPHNNTQPSLAMRYIIKT